VGALLLVLAFLMAFTFVGEISAAAGAVCIAFGVMMVSERSSH
jgi:hypothetical protein